MGLVPPMVGLPYVGSELTLGRTQFQKCRTEDAPNGFVLEWLSDGVPLPTGRQGEFLKLLPQDRGHRISMIVHTQCQTPTAFRSTETPPIEASNRAMGWTDRGNFDGDGVNDVLARDRQGNLHLYPGDGAGGWNTPLLVGHGWDIFKDLI